MKNSFETSLWRYFSFRPAARFILHSSLIISLSACFSAKQLRNNAYILTAQTVKGNKAISGDALLGLIPQKPNGRILGLPITPRLWYYQYGLRRYDHAAAVKELEAKTNEFEQQSQQFANNPKALKRLNRRYGRKLKHLRLVAEKGNYWMRNLGEPPAYFSAADAKANAIKMQKYLFDKGFFDAKTGFTLDTLRRRQIRVNYLITENDGYYLRNLYYTIADPRVDSIVRKSLDQSRLKVGDRFDFDNLSGERVRIETLLRDQGYYEFSRQYVRATDIDTTRYNTHLQFYNATEQRDTTHQPVDVGVRIDNPPGRSAHPVYHIGEVEVQINPADAPGISLSPDPTLVNYDTLQRSGVVYVIGGRDVSTRLMNSKILLRPGQLYSQSNYRNTQRQLLLLNQFKFVNLNFTDTTNRQLRALITAPLLDKYEATAEGGVTGLLYQGQGYPGGFGSLVFRVRNMFGGMETFETSARLGLEAQTGFLTDPNATRQVYTSQELGISSSLIFPQILFPSRLRFRFNPYAPRTQVSLSFNNTFRPDFRRSLLRATMAYNWQVSAQKQFSFLIADINLINAGAGTEASISDAFYKQLTALKEQGSTIYLSFFRRSLSSSFSFAYTYNTNVPGQNRRANFLRMVLESGGTTLNFVSNQTVARLSDSATGVGLQFYKFLRANVDYRHYVPLNRRTTFAVRVNTGLVYGYGPDNAVPYEKFFFVGGSNSVRAWLPRRLGPGAAYPYLASAPNQPAINKETGQFVYLFEQPGNVLLEGSAELRGRLFHLGADVNGAIFVDAGNVWTLSNNSTRPGAAFQLDTFIPQIAVGTGVGLRFDFSFFVVRFDGGIKVWDPARRYIDASDGQLVDDRFILPKFSLRQLSSGPNPLVINFGIGYPF